MWREDGRCQSAKGRSLDPCARDLHGSKSQMCGRPAHPLPHWAILSLPRKIAPSWQIVRIQPTTSPPSLQRLQHKDGVPYLDGIVLVQRHGLADLLAVHEGPVCTAKVPDDELVIFDGELGMRLGHLRVAEDDLGPIPTDRCAVVDAVHLPPGACPP